MRKKWIACCVVTAIGVAGLTGGTIAVQAAETPAALATGINPGALRLLISGQVGRLLALRDSLDLTADQKLQIKTILKSDRTEIVDAIRPVVDKHRALRDAVTAQTPDDKAIRAAASDLGTSIGDAAIVASKVRGELNKVLTPDQQQKVEAFQKETSQGVDRFLDRLANPS